MVGENLQRMKTGGDKPSNDYEVRISELEAENKWLRLAVEAWVNRDAINQRELSRYKKAVEYFMTKDVCSPESGCGACDEKRAATNTILKGE